MKVLNNAILNTAKTCKNGKDSNCAGCILSEYDCPFPDLNYDLKKSGYYNMSNQEQYEMLCEKAKKYDSLKWIPVNKELPFTDVDVLADDGMNMFVAWYDGDDWYSFDDNYKRDCPILAWRPLHEPYYPESEEKE